MKHNLIIAVLILAGSTIGSLSGALATDCVDYGEGPVDQLGEHWYGQDRWQNTYVVQATYGHFLYARNPQVFGVEIIDISNPATPFTAGVITDGYAPGMEDAVVSDDHLFASNWAGVSVYDLSNPVDPIHLGDFPHPDVGLYQIDVQGGYLYLGSLVNGLEIATLDPDPDSIAVIGQFPMRTKSVHVSGNLAFLRNDGNDKGSLMILDVGDPYDIRQLADFGGTAAGLHYGNSIAVKGSIAFANSTDGIMVLDLADPSSPQLLGWIPVPRAQYVAIAGDALYATQVDYFLHVVDVSDPVEPVYRGAGTWSNGGLAYQMGFGSDVISVTTQTAVRTFPYDCLSRPLASAELPMVAALPFEANPNPFNPRTTFRYTLDAPGRVEIQVYDLLGRRLVSLAEGTMGAGDHQAQWNGLDSDGRAVSSSTYLAVLQVDGLVRGNPVKLSLVR